jgi:cobalt-precorrin-5B (C1)-methyltransferase
MSLQPVPKGDLRWGYSTGACATACTKAALLALIEQHNIPAVHITLPVGQEVLFKIHGCTYSATTACCATYKDSGDDPDVTNGAEIACIVEFNDREGVHFLQGEGVGLVTLPGLPVAPGEPAINPVPRQMMQQVVAELLMQYNIQKGVSIRVSVTNGAAIAEKTLNARLGITGGISILGTTGMVKPFSADAYIASIEQGVDVAVANGLTEIVVNSGGRSEKILQRLYPHLPSMAFVQYGNWIGETLAKIRSSPLNRFVIGMMLGKAVKLAGGMLNTHSNQSSWDKDFVASLADEAGYLPSMGDAIRQLNMARGLTGLFPFKAVEPFYKTLAIQCSKVIRQQTGSLPFDIILMDATDQYMVFDQF